MRIENIVAAQKDTITGSVPSRFVSRAETKGHRITSRHEITGDDQPGCWAKFHPVRSLRSLAQLHNHQQPLQISPMVRHVNLSDAVHFLQRYGYMKSRRFE